MLPLVTLAVPVYNGSSLLPAALAGLRGQNYRNLEILISDNASTDRTGDICREAAASDARIRYIRQPANIGAAANFDFLAREAHGEFFAWNAHDDVRPPRFVEACVAELQRRPEAVLCNGKVEFVDGTGRPLRRFWDPSIETRQTTAAERVSVLLDRTLWVDVYGLMRRDALLRALPYEPTWGADVLLTMRLLMLGEFARVPEKTLVYEVEQKPIAFCMEEVTAKAYADPLPYTGMLRDLFRDAAPSAPPHELLARFVRAVVEHPNRSPQASWCANLVREHPELGRAPTLERFAAAVMEWLASALPEGSRAATVAGAREILGEGYPPDAPHLRQPGQPGGPPKTLVSRARARLARMFGSSPLLSRRRGPPLTG